MTELRDRRKNCSAIMIDNYDSFVYNIVQYLQGLGLSSLKVFRNDKISVSQVMEMKPDLIFISPGPSEPSHAGICKELIQASIDSKTPVFGVCLGHQSIAEVLGGKIVRLAEPVHGKTSKIIHDGQGVFRNLPDRFTATRYHSLIVDPESTPNDLTVTAKTEDGVIMGLRHKNLPIEGVQFHPEAILTEHGMQMLQNFCDQHLSL